MDYDKAYKDIGANVKDFKDLEIRSLNNAVKTLEYMLQQKNQEIADLKGKIDTMMKVFIGN